MTPAAEYRRVGATVPFHPVGAEGEADWFFDDPERVVAETPHPTNEYYVGADWRDTYVVIGGR